MYNIWFIQISLFFFFTGAVNAVLVYMSLNIENYE